MKKEVITLPQVKKILEEVKPDEMDQIHVEQLRAVEQLRRQHGESALRAKLKATGLAS